MKLVRVGFVKQVGKKVGKKGSFLSHTLTSVGGLLISLSWAFEPVGG